MIRWDGVQTGSQVIDIQGEALASTAGQTALLVVVSDANQWNSGQEIAGIRDIWVLSSRRESRYESRQSCGCKRTVFEP